MITSPAKVCSPSSGGLIRNLEWQGILVIAIVVGITLRMTLRFSTTLWEDEIIAATHAVQPVARLITNVVIHDIHPPLYFLELHFWSSLGQTDSWLVANSTLFSVVALASILYTVHRTMDLAHALGSAAVLAVLPSAIWMAQELRMYAMLSVILIWLFYFTHLFFARAEQSARNFFGVLILGTATVYTHAIGFFAVFFYAVYAASWLFTRRASRRDWLLWFLAFAIVGVMAIPLLVGDMVHKADMPPPAGLSDIAGWMGSVVTGEGYKTVPWLEPAGAFIFILIMCLGTAYLQTRRVTWCFLILPMFFCFALGVTVKPIFKANFFSTFFSPFLAIVVASLVISLPFGRVIRSTLLGCVLGALLVMAVVNRLALDATNGYYGRVASAIAHEKQAGDVVWAPQGDIFWGMAWYLIGPDWGSPLAIATPFRPQSRWWKVFDWLGPDLVQNLGVLPTSQTITTSDGLPIMMGAESQPKVQQAKRVWLVTYAPRNDIPDTLPGEELGSMRKVRTLSFPPVQLDLYAGNAGVVPR